MAARSLALFAFLLVLAWGTGVRADIVPPSTDLPSPLSLEKSLEIFRAHGLDLLIADAATRNAEGAVKMAGAIPNPVFSSSVGNAFTWSNNAYSNADCLRNGTACSPWVYNLGISDGAAVEDWVSGKRDLRLKVARNALAAAKLSRVDAERAIAFQVKAAYLQVAQATLAYKFAKDVAENQATVLRKFRDRYARGAIHEGDLQRIEVEKLQAEEARDTSEAILRTARINLGYLLGVRGTVTDFEVDTKVLDYSVPVSLQNPTEISLMRVAFDHRPDLMSLGYQKVSAEAGVALVKRQRFPDIQVSANYQWGGFGGLSTNGPVGQQILTFGLTFPLPIFYQMQGEQKQAEARYDLASLEHAKATSQVVNDVSIALATLNQAKRAVERMEGPRRDGGGILMSAKGAFEIIALQYEKGAASLTDYLDALRTYIATKNQYFSDLTAYWTAVYQLEAAVAADLR